MAKVMLVLNSKVWDRFEWETYGGCIDGILEADYLQVPNRPYFVRSDLVVNPTHLTEMDASATMVPSPQLTSNESIQLHVLPDSSGLVEPKLIGVAVMFGTYQRTNQGSATLVLSGPTREERIDFDLSQLADNQFQKFDFNPGDFTSMEILSAGGGGVSVWESHSDSHGQLSCIRYFYEDGRVDFTPGCP
jgi:hypothetical protein